MTSSLPGVYQTELDRQLGAVAVAPGEVPVIFGCSSSGTANAIKNYAGGDTTTVVTDAGYGPGPQLVALLTSKGFRCVFIKVATVTAGAAAATKTGGGTAAPTAAGANDTRRILVEVLTAGALGTAGIVFRWSPDGGLSWSRPIALGTALTYVFQNTGTTLTWGTNAATVTVTTRVEIKTTEPTWDATAIAAAIAALRNSSTVWDWFAICGPATKALFDGIKSELSTLIATLKRKTSGMLEAPRQGADTEDDWMDDQIADYETADESHLLVGAGETQQYSPIDKCFYMRPLMWDCALRACQVDSLKFELGRVKADGNGGPILGTIFDSSGNPIAHNEERNEGLDTTGAGGTARFATARTHATKGKSAYITRANMMALPGSDYSTWRLRRGMDVACNITRGVLTDEIQETPPLEATGERAGHVTVKYAKAVESSCRNALYERLVKPGRVSDAYVVVGLEDNILSTKKIKVKTRVTPLGCIDFIEEEDAYENPALTAAAQGA